MADSFDITTIDYSDGESIPSGDPEAQRSPRLTVLHHPDPTLVGASAPLPDLAAGLPVAISRNHPEFYHPGPAPEGPLTLGLARVSRKPLWLSRVADRLLITSSGRRQRARVEAEPLLGERALDWAQLQAEGVFIELGGSVLMWLHDGLPPARDPWGVIGVSQGIGRVREAIGRIGPLEVPVLIRGESGVGKELVARALHGASPRANGPWVPVNMAAVPVSMGASALFGHARGAFTGAVDAQPGWFGQADGGTLFLDEIGETPEALQPQLLRALDSGEIQPVGRPARTVDVRLIAATDANLEEMVRQSTFRRALLHRLQGAMIDVPPLRERRADLPLLLHHFLGEALASMGARDRLSASRDAPWLGMRLLRRLMRHDFPGNVRELRNIATGVAVYSHDRPEAALPPELEARLEQSAGGSSPSLPPPPSVDHDPTPDELVDPLALTEDRVRASLRRNQYNVTRTATELGVAKNTLSDFIRAQPGLNLAGDLDVETILSAVNATDGDLDTAAQALEVSPHGLRLRMRALGMR
ncbi:MAG: sigma-54-dependent Fis family transcriptional regulator [Alphaproteobacteria bacterium]|nr:sigma-54-dependent Fis family transcriptional regulator [Alphaproteobacteria bacterium]